MTCKPFSSAGATRREILTSLLSGALLFLPRSSDADPADRKSEIQAGQMKVLTFNSWAMPASFAKDQGLRVSAIAERFSEGEFDVVGLQEVWDTGSQATIARGAARGGLRYSHYFKNGIYGSGIMILSRYPSQQPFSNLSASFIAKRIAVP